jgi:uncharacterized Tic20 family protein
MADQFPYPEKDDFAQTPQNPDVPPEYLNSSFNPEPAYVPPPTSTGTTPPPPTQAYPPPAPLSPADERTWAMLAHLSVLLNLVTGFLGPAASFVIYLMYKDRSRYVAFHAMQATLMQLVFWIGGGVLAAIAWTFSGLLTVVIIGLCCMPFAFLISLLPLGALIYGVIGAIQVNQGQDFRYWLVADWVAGP